MELFGAIWSYLEIFGPFHSFPTSSTFPSFPTFAKVLIFLLSLLFLFFLPLLFFLLFLNFLVFLLFLYFYFSYFSCIFSLVWSRDFQKHITLRGQRYKSPPSFRPYRLPHWAPFWRDMGLGGRVIPENN